MPNRWLHCVSLDFLLLFLPCAAAAQGPLHIQEVGAFTPNALLSSGLASMSLWSAVNESKTRSPLQGPSGSVSKLDLKAPGKARREYEKGYQLLMRRDFKAAADHLVIAVSAYPEFVAAHNALGSAYLDLGQNEQARDQFAIAVSLDDHVPTSFLNLGCAQLTLKDYRSAEDAVQKASTIAPLDLQLAMALTYAQYMNQDYGAVIMTAHLVHARKHQGAAMVHYYAAAALDSQNHSQEALNELQTLLLEDPKSPAADHARQIMAEIKAEQIKKEARKTRSEASASVTNPPVVTPAEKRSTPEEVAAQRQIALQESKEAKQIAEVESASEPMCATCSSTASLARDMAPGRLVPSPSAERPGGGETPFTLQSVVDEVAVFFAATDHGKSVTNLTREEIAIRDDEKAPSAITGFRNEAQLPLRLGIVIDTSESIAGRFSFEQRAAMDFLQKILVDKNDLGFVVGVANSVLLVQDFTSDRQRISHAIGQLAPSGGTALWDAVSFAADKLARREEAQPVARMLVVISDGKDNSSSVTLKEAVASAERGEVFVYTVSTREANDGDDFTLVGDRDIIGEHALKVLAERSGGAAFVPGSITGLNHGLDELQQVIRSRYLISYRPALFKHDGQYRPINIIAKKSGRKLRVYARKGYYTSVNSAGEAN